MPWDGTGRPVFWGGQIHGGSSGGHNIYLPASAGQGADSEGGGTLCTSQGVLPTPNPEPNCDGDGAYTPGLDDITAVPACPNISTK